MANLPISPSISPIYINQSVSFSTTPGYYSYSWSSSPNPPSLTGTSYQSNAVTFTTEGLYDIQVEVCGDETGCCQTFQDRIYVFGGASDCDYDVTGSISGAPVSHTVPAGLNTDVYIWFKIGGYPDKLIIRDASDAVLLDTRFIGNRQQYYQLQDPDNDDITPSYPTAWYYPLWLENAGGVAVGASITGVSPAALYATCSTNDLVSPVVDISPILATDVKAKRSNNFGTGNVDVGIYIKIPQSVHGGNLMTINGYPFQNYTCGFTNVVNKASFQVSCNPITAAGDNTW